VRVPALATLSIAILIGVTACSAGPGEARYLTPVPCVPGTELPGTELPGTAAPGAVSGRHVPLPDDFVPAAVTRCTSVLVFSPAPGGPPGTAGPGTARPGTAGPGAAGPGAAGPGAAGPGAAGPGTAGPGTAGPGTGAWQWATVQRSTGPFGDLVRALRTPPPKPSGGLIACPAIAAAPIGLTLTDRTGRMVTPGIPATVCGLVLPAVSQALDSLTWTTLRSGAK
jgi:hypothetical protein